MLRGRQNLCKKQSKRLVLASVCTRAHCWCSLHTHPHAPVLRSRPPRRTLHTRARRFIHNMLEFDTFASGLLQENRIHACTMNQQLLRVFTQPRTLVVIKRLNEQWKQTKSSLWRSMSEHRCATLFVEPPSPILT